MIRLLKLLSIAFFMGISCTVFALTIDKGDIKESQLKSDKTYLRGELIRRSREGLVSTTVGDFQIAAGISVDDRRPIGEWFSEQNKANVSLGFSKGQLVSITIY
ncbi:hypothetical protein A9Q81_04850 [Gammaproteobacteria bacterium 42_54_T18]|nr:hypothetical protein A9Q81_04850 [Gammaproteobacteria bacterium 42_54_T18]